MLIFPQHRPASERIIVPQRNRGFTLVEMAVALVIVALLLGSLLSPLSQQIEQRRIGDAQKAIDLINEALLGFAISQASPRLPCPDTDNDGIEDSPCAAGSATEGNVPWATLGTPHTDPWGQRYRYRVTNTFAAGPITFALTGNLQVCSTSGCGVGNIVATSVPAVIYSTGAVVMRTPTASPDETENSHGTNNAFVSRVFSSVAGSEFDDLVSFVSTPILISRLVVAQRLP